MADGEGMEEEVTGGWLKVRSERIRLERNSSGKPIAPRGGRVS